MDIPPNRPRYRPMSREQHHFVLRDLQSGQRFTTTEENVVDEETGAALMLAEETQHRASCGHVVGEITQLIGCSLCEREVCPSCQVRCSRCLRVLCNEHGRWSGAKLYCPRCRILVVAQRTGLMCCNAVLWIVARSMRAVPALFRGLHRLLSKEL